MKRASPGRRGGVFAVAWETFIKDNKVIPPVLAVIALLIFSWVVAGAFLGGPDESISSRQGIAPGGGEVAQSETQEEAAPPAPEIDNPNAESFAAYESKDPFRPLFAPVSTDTGDTSATSDGSEAINPDGGNGEDGGDGGSDGSGGAGSGGDGDRTSSEEDGGTDGDGARTDPTRAPADAQYDNNPPNNGDVGRNGRNSQNASDAQGAGGGQDGQGGRDARGGDAGGSRGGGAGGSRGASGEPEKLFDSGGNLPNPR